MKAVILLDADRRFAPAIHVMDVFQVEKVYRRLGVSVPIRGKGIWTMHLYQTIIWSEFSTIG